MGTIRDNIIKLKKGNKLAGAIIILSLLFFGLMPTGLSKNIDDPWWNEDWSYRQELIIPINISYSELAGQSIDILFNFDNPCWAKDENIHSVRVIKQERGQFKELESQIYDLNYNSTNSNFINSCNLVFLIPTGSTGKEKYFVYYDESEKFEKTYTDHVVVEDSYIYYNPFIGFSFESWFYKVVEDERVVYTVVKEGSHLDKKISQQVVKIKKDYTDLLPDSGEDTINTCFTYWWYKNNEWHLSSTSNKYLKSEILIDGNLMVKFGIVSESNDGLFRSTIYYTYYYQAKEDKGLNIHSKHEATGKPIPTGDMIETSFMYINSGIIKSSNIKELNVGRIPKYLHFYSEEEKIVTFKLDQYPENTEWQYLISTENDYDLGSKAWISFDDGDSGKAYGVILNSTDVVRTKVDEPNGVQMTYTQRNMFRLPGLDVKIAYLYLIRNAFDSDVTYDSFIPENYVVEFDALFYSTPFNGYKQIDKQSKLFQNLVKYQPKNNKEINPVSEDLEEYSLSVTTHLPLGLISKLISSKLLFKNSKTVIELIKDDEIIGLETSKKLALTQDLKIDWTNLSIFRKTTFNHIRPGKYLIKVYLEDSAFGDEKQFIGFDLIDIEDDVKVNIFCRPQGKIKLNFKDQYNESIKGVRTKIYKDGVKLFDSKECQTDEINIGLPIGRSNNYTMNVFYKGYLVKSEEVKLSLINLLVPIVKDIEFDCYDYKVSVMDENGHPVDFEVNLGLTNDDMDKITLNPDKSSNGVYEFENIIPAKYNLSIEYDLVKIIKQIKIPDDSSFNITLYDYTIKITDLLNLTPSVEFDIYLSVEEFSNKVKIYPEKINDNIYKFSNLYPANYKIVISYRTGSRSKDIVIPPETSTLDMKFPFVYNLSATIYDTHGLILPNVKVELTKNGVNISGITDDSGEVIFNIPPGEYLLKVYSDNGLISSRKVSIYNEKSIELVTSKEPIYPYVVVIIGIIALISTAILLLRKKQKLLCLKIASIIIILIALVLPWWSLNGEIVSPHLETSTNMYIIPTEMITITSNSDETAGYIAAIDPMFSEAIDVIPFLLILSIILICLSIFIDYFTTKKKTSSVLLVLSTILIMFVLIGFFIGMSLLSELIIGSLAGTGDIDIKIFSENNYQLIKCNWGIGIGYYLYIISSVIMAIITIMACKNNFLKSIKKLMIKSD